MKNILQVTFCALLFTACANNKPTQDPSIVPPAKSVSQTDTISLAPVNTSNNLTKGNAPGQQIIMPATQPAASTNMAGINPAHGAPGHRCDISVGAPLNSAPAASKTIITTPTQVSVPANAAGNSTARLNPAHGAPGHDCKIPVGQPLN